MGNYEYMMAKCREFRSKQWDEEELRKCIGMLKSLTREKLLKVYHCRFLDEKHFLRIAAFNPHCSECPNTLMKLQKNSSFRPTFLSDKMTNFIISPKGR